MADRQKDNYSDDADEEESDEDPVGKEPVGGGLKEVRIKLQRIRSQNEFPIAAVQPVRVTDASERASQPTSTPPRPTLVIKQSTTNPPKRTLPPAQPATDPSRSKPPESQTIAESLPESSKPANAPSEFILGSLLSEVFSLEPSAFQMVSKAVQTDASFSSRYGLTAMQRAPDLMQRAAVRRTPTPDSRPRMSVPRPPTPGPQPRATIEIPDSSPSSTASPKRDPPAPAPTNRRQGGANTSGPTSRPEPLPDQQISNAMLPEAGNRIALQQHQSDGQGQSCGCCPVTRSSAQLSDHSRHSRAGGSELPSRSYLIQDYPTYGQMTHWPQVDVGNNCLPDEYLTQSTALQRQQRQYAGTDTSTSLRRDRPRQLFVYAANSLPQERMHHYSNGGVQNQYRYAPYTLPYSTSMGNRGASDTLLVPNAQNCHCQFHQGFVNTIPPESQCIAWPDEMTRAGSHQGQRPYYPSAQIFCMECYVSGTFCPRHSGNGNAY